MPPARPKLPRGARLKASLKPASTKVSALHHLLPHYERELAQLRSLAEDFARRYPHVTGRMSVAGELLQDPHVERLLQAFALIGSRVRERLDDDYSLFTESLLAQLAPQYLSALPACAIACFVPGTAAGQNSAVGSLPRGQEVNALMTGKLTCSFRTTAALQVLPLRITSARFRATATVPAGTAVPRKTVAILSLGLELVSPQALWSELGAESLRLYLDGDRALVPHRVRELQHTNIRFQGARQ